MDEAVVRRESTGSCASGGKLVFPTTRFGEVTVAADTLLHFPRGMVGLAHAQRFVFLHDARSPGPIFWLQSVDDPALAFLVCEPHPFFPDYEVTLQPSDLAVLGPRAADELLVCVILVVPEDPRRIHANLAGPLVIHTGSRTGVQLVLSGDEYPLRAPLFVEDRLPEEEDPVTQGGGGACSS